MLGLAIDPGKESSGVVSFVVTTPSLVPPFGVVPENLAAQAFGVAGGQVPNEDLRSLVRRLAETGAILAVEVIPGIYGGKPGKSSTGADQLASDRWGARFVEAWTIGREDSGLPPLAPSLIYRATARACVTGGSSKAKDSDVRQAIIDLYGGDAVAFGRRCPKCKGEGVRGAKRMHCGDCNGSGWLVPRGPLFGWTGSHLFAALAVAIAACDPSRKG